MKCTAIFKAKKLLKISLEHDGKLIESVQIHGDFFFYPEEKISQLEASLCGCPLDRSSLLQRISEFLKTATAFGFEAEDLASAILMAAEKREVL